MSDRERPWSKFYWSDWDSDQGLRQCSLAAQGLWMRMLVICAKSEPRGYLAINGQPLEASGLATAVSRPQSEVEPLLEELERWGVFSRDRRRWIYSRRMIADEKRSKMGAKAKKEAISRAAQLAENKEGNPSPSRGATRGASPQRPETRDQSPEVKNPPVLPSVGHPPGEPTPTGQTDLLGEPTKPNTKNKPQVATRIPDDWEANEALRRFGLEQLGDAARLDREIDKFKDFWRAKAGADARKMDWDATFKNWCRRAAEEQPRNGQRFGNSAIVIDGKPKPPGANLLAELGKAASGPLESARSRAADDPFRT